MVSSGKISEAKLNMIKRWGFAHNNALESYSVFTGAVLIALVVKVDAGKMNGLMALYTMARLAYAVAYFAIEGDTVAQIRGVLWWVGNLNCLSLMWMAGKKLNE